MLRMSPRLTLLIVVVGPAVGFVIGRMSKAFRRYSARIQTSMGDVTKVTEESVHGQRIVKVFGGQEHEKQHFADINQRNFRFNVRLVAVQAAGDNLTAYVVVLGVAAVMYLLVRGSERAGLHRLRDGDGHGAHTAQAPDQRQRRRAARHRCGGGTVRDPRRAGRDGHRHGGDRAARAATSNTGTSRSRTRPTSRPRCAV